MKKPLVVLAILVLLGIIGVFLRSPDRGTTPGKQQADVVSVQVLALIDETGHVVDAKVEQKGVPEVLAVTALEAVRLATYAPAEQGGQPVKAWVNVPVIFHRTGDGKYEVLHGVTDEL